MEVELAEMTETVTGVFAKGTLALDTTGTGLGSQALYTGTQQGAGGAMKSLALGNAGGVAKSASVVGKGAVVQAQSAASFTAKTGSIWTGGSKLGLGKLGLTMANFVPLLFVGTLIAVGVGVYGFLQNQSADSGVLPDAMESPPPE